MSTQSIHESEAPAGVAALPHMATFHRFAFIKDAKIKKTNAIGAAGFVVFRVVMSLIFGTVVGGLVAAFHPLAGLAVGFVLFITSMLGSRRAYGLWQGSCPHCDREIWISGGNGRFAFNCPICTRRVLQGGAQFEAV